jgi:membrane protease YdiL (CAAX protease family)
MKKPFLYALLAIVYIVDIVLGIQMTNFFPQKETILIPMTMLGLFVLSALVMGFLFLSEPLKLFMENKKQEALVFFTRTIGFFACFVVIFIVILVLI